MARNVCVFVFEDFQLLDASGPITAFELASHFGKSRYRVTVASLKGGLVKSSSGVPIHTEHPGAADVPDTLIVSGGVGIEAAMTCGETLAFLQRSASSARRVCSVCSGSMLLAAAGLLDHRRATTHWRRAEQFAGLFPDVQLEPDRIYLRDGDIWTSAGISAGIDLALALIAHDMGEKVAAQVAREMVVYFRRPGGQSQFSALAGLDGEQRRFTPLLDWIRRNLDARLAVDVLAERAAMSPRNFSRAFRQDVGLSPAKAVERLRLETAREKVEHSGARIEQIAVLTGFNDAERMRRAFLRAFGQPPQAMRRAAKRTMLSA